MTKEKKVRKRADDKPPHRLYEPPRIGQVWESADQRNRRELFHVGPTLIGWRSPEGTEYIGSALAWRLWWLESGAELIVDVSDPKDA